MLQSEMRRCLPRRAVFCIAFGLASVATCDAAQVLYGITQGDQLITIDASTGSGVLVGALSTSMNAIGLAQTGGNLYALDSNQNVLRQLNPATAATLTTVAVGFTTLDAVGEGDLAFNGTGTGFLVSSLFADGSFGGGSFFSLNLGAHSHTLVSNTLIQLFSGLAFNSIDSTMYAMTSDGSALYTISTITGNVTSVGSTGISNPDAVYGGLSFSSSGILFATVGDGSTDSMLYRLNTTTGAGTLVGDTGFLAVSGIAFLGSGPGPSTTPEPSTGLLMLSIPLAFAAGRKFRKREARS